MPSSNPNRPTMRAATLVAPRQFEIQSVPIPTPGPGQVRVRLHGCGVCGSNLPVFQGRPWFNYPLPPGQPGHEGWGEVDALGEGATTLAPGDRVALLSYAAFAEYDIAPATHTVKLPPPLEKQAFPGEALGCALNVVRRTPVEPGQSVAVVGLGFLGLALIPFLKQKGAKVIAIGRRPHPRQVASAFGANHSVVMDDHWRVIDKVKALTNGQGCAAAIECTGHQWPLDLAAELTAERGTLVIAGFHQDGPRQIDLQSWNWRGLDVVNAHERDPLVYVQAMQLAAGAMAAGWLQPDPAFTHIAPLDQINQACAALETRPPDFIKSILTA